jgi:acyl-CoA oxidase
MTVDHLTAHPRAEELPAPAQPAPAQPDRAELLDLVFDGNFERVHRDLRDVLFDPIFDAREGLTLQQAGELAYERSRFVHSRLERPLQILGNPLRLFALAEWPCVLDVSTFSLLMVHYNLCLGSLVDHGSDRADLADYFEDLDSLAAFGPYMATELGYGNNVAALRTEAHYDQDADCFVLNTPDSLAQKYMSYSGFSHLPKLAVVMARLKADGVDHGIFPFVVRISDEDGLCPGIRAVPCPEKPVQGLDNGLTWFDHVRIPRRNLLYSDMARFTDDGHLQLTSGNARRRFLRSMSRIQPGRLCVSSSAVSAGRAATYIALRYAQHRLTNAPGRRDVPILEYRSHQLALITALAKVYAMTLLVNTAKREFLAAGTAVPADLNDLISITKALSTWEMTEVVAVCRERCGAQGIFSVNRIADYGSLLQGLVTAEGDNQVLLATTAGQLLSRGDDAAPVAAPDPHGRDVTDVSWQVELMHYRERMLFDSCRESMSADGGYFDAWNGSINAGLAMARQRGVRVALHSMSVAADKARVPGVRSALGLLASLYGIIELQREDGWYAASGCLTGEQVLGLPGQADALCARLVHHIPMLIEGFGLTPELLRAPIAAEDYVGAFEAHSRRSAGVADGS